MTALLTRLALLAFLLLAAERPAQAYLDPGSGSMLLQLLLGGFAAAGVILRLYWVRIRSMFGFRSRDDSADSAG